LQESYIEACKEARIEPDEDLLINLSEEEAAMLRSSAAWSIIPAIPERGA
jgi:hypothetical protein